MRRIMTPFVRGFALAAILFGGFGLYGFRYIHAPIEVVVTQPICTPLLGGDTLNRWIN